MSHILPIFGRIHIIYVYTTKNWQNTNILILVVQHKIRLAGIGRLDATQGYIQLFRG